MRNDNLSLPIQNSVQLEYKIYREQLQFDLSW
jgi:hypothetical protein